MRYGVCFFLLVFVLSCTDTPVQQQPVQQPIIEPTIPEDDPLPAIVETKEKSPLVLLFDSLGLVDIQQLDSTILVELKYATADNFTGEVIYHNFHQAYLHPVAANKLVKAQQLLRERHPDFHLLVYDAARPQHVQQQLWDKVKGTPLSMYVAHPEKTGLHNYGMAVDLTIADSLSIPLDMGTPFDHFGKEAGITQEEWLLTMGLLTQEHINNRRLLRSIMRQAGFYAIEGEWWHFNACSRSEAKEKCELIR